MITPNDIETKVFASAMRGYKKEEVDQFLDEVMADYQGLIAENERLKRDVAHMKEEVEEGKKTQKSVLKTLDQAKSLMADISASAEKRAEAIIRNAHTDADRIISDAKNSAASLNAQSSAMAGRLANFRDGYRRMLTDELRRLDNDGSDDLLNDLRKDFYPEANLVDAGLVGSAVSQAEDVTQQDEWTPPFNEEQSAETDPASMQSEAPRWTAAIETPQDQQQSNWASIEPEQESADEPTVVEEAKETAEDELWQPVQETSAEASEEEEEEKERQSGTSDPESLTEQVMSELNGDNYAEVNEESIRENEIDFGTVPVDAKATTIVIRHDERIPSAEPPEETKKFDENFLE